MAANRSEKDVTRRFLLWGSGIIIGGMALSLAFVAVLSILGISFFAVSGNSMAPTLTHGQNIVLQKDDGIRRDQIFLFNKPESWEYMGTDRPLLIKRTHAIPGDTLAYREGVFFVNDEEIFDTITEDYECDPGVETYEHTLTKEETFVIGDNTHESLDSLRIFCDGELENTYVSARDLVDYGSILTTF